MSLLTVHLRWNCVSAQQYESVLAAAPEASPLPAGCLSRQLRRQGQGLLDTEVWDSETAGRMDQMVDIVREAGVHESPQTAIFAVPGIFAAGYRRCTPPVALPRPAAVPTVELLPEASTVGILAAADGPVTR